MAIVMFVIAFAALVGMLSAWITDHRSKRPALQDLEAKSAQLERAVGLDFNSITAENDRVMEEIDQWLLSNTPEGQAQLAEQEAQQKATSTVNTFGDSHDAVYLYQLMQTLKRYGMDTANEIR